MFLSCEGGFDGGGMFCVRPSPSVAKCITGHPPCFPGRCGGNWAKVRAW